MTRASEESTAGWLRDTGTSALALGATAGMVGALVGGYLAYRLQAGAQGGGASLGILLGAAIGEGLLFPTGVHLANRRQGKLRPSLLAALAIALAAAAAYWVGVSRDLAGVARWSGTLGLLAQAAACLWLERSTAAPAPRVPRTRGGRHRPARRPV